MTPSDITSGSIISILLITLFFMVVYPFLKALLIYLATKMIKFNSVSYWKSFFCVLIGIGAMMLIQTIYTGLTLSPGNEFDPELLIASSFLVGIFIIILTPIVEAISLYLFFKESAGKTIGAIALAYLFIIGIAILFFLVIIIISFLIGLVSG